MVDETTDRIAREAARLLHTKQIDEIDRAIGAAAERLGLDDRPRPGSGRVRKHLQAMSMQAMGDAGYEQQRQHALSIVEQLMTAIEESIDDARTLLVGRAAKGLLDGPGAVHVRVYTDLSMREVAELLTDQGYDDPDFETADTKLGRLDRLRVVEEDLEIVLTRCRPDQRRSADRDLFTARPIATLDLADLRARLDG